MSPAEDGGMEISMKFEIVPTEEAAALRKAFIERFIDTTSAYYQKYIATLVQYADGFYYDRYLWECLKDNEEYQKECRMEDVAAFLRDKKSVFVMWDLFSKERRRDDKRFSMEYPANTIINVRGDYLAQIVVEEWNTEQAAWDAYCVCQGLWFPADIYCFDESMKWYAIFTHESHDSLTNPELDDNTYIRICFLSS